MNIREIIAETNPDAILFDDMDEAIIGLGQQWGGNTVVTYDREKCINILAHNFEENDKENEDVYIDAVEYFEFNIECAYVGENTPIFITPIEEINF